MNRRKFISIATLSGLISTKVVRSEEELISNRSENSDVTEQSPTFKTTRILPLVPEAGSIAAITAPASPTSEWEIRSAVNAMKRLGLKVEVGQTVKNRVNKYKYFSAPDEQRAEEFMQFIDRDDVSVILCGRGGYGTLRILPLLDYSLIMKKPKIIMGFSDITALLNAIYVRSGLVCFHGPVAVSTFENDTILSLNKLFFPKVDYKPINIKDNSFRTFGEGESEGQLVGGNLSLLVATLGTSYEINTNGAILFIEEVSEHPYRIDRMLTQLMLAGKFDNCKGVVVGYIKGANSKRHFFPGGSYTINQTIESILKPLGIPVLMGLPIGHIKNQFTLPIGIKAMLDLANKSLTILEPSVIYEQV